VEEGSIPFIPTNRSRDANPDGGQPPDRGGGDSVRLCQQPRRLNRPGELAQSAERVRMINGPDLADGIKAYEVGGSIPLFPSGTLAE
jgi:hypothetical protein